MLIIVPLLLTSCNGKTNNGNGKEIAGTPVITYDTSLKSGVVTEKVICRNDANVSYSLYLPSGYKAGNEYPAIYLFDPHADGLLPINKYKDLAEKYGYILIGSYNSKNGMDWEGVHQSLKTMFEDSQARLSIDKNRIYTGGFSGGSRVASSMAIYDGGIKGVIGCSAGFPQLTKQLENKFDFIGIAGNEDFNMTEMKNLDKNLDATGIRHTLIIFNGKHEWSDKEVFEKAFQWIQLNEMKDKMIAVNNKMVNEINQSYQKQIKETEAKGMKYEALLLYKQMLSFLNGIMDVSSIRKSSDSLANLDDVKKTMQFKADMEKRELEIQQNYAQEFTSKDLNWWNNEIKQLNAKTRSNDPETVQMYKRILGYLSLVAFSYSNNSLNGNHLDQADMFIKLYALIDPSNSEHSYMSATLFAKKNEKNKVIPALKEAVKLGFDDIGRLQNDPVFTSMKNNKDFQEVIGSINIVKVD
jgi:poly(3-hydroxybutyrate) depolymerase/CRISPR/Cas system CSM-associated protein Csm2 small subunit